MARKSIDWNNAPSWAKWYAIDEDGSGWWFENKPRISKRSKEWEVRKISSKYQRSCDNDATNWQQSLTQQPVEKKLK